MVSAASSQEVEEHRPHMYADIVNKEVRWLQTQEHLLPTLYYGTEEQTEAYAQCILDNNMYPGNYDITGPDISIVGRYTIKCSEVWPR